MSKPIFVFVPGAWHPASTFNRLAARLKAAGYESRSVEMASYGANPPLTSVWPDVDAVRREVETIVDNGQDVILVMHSSGGIAGCEASLGLDERTRQAQGKEGAVIRLIFCCAFLVPEGTALIDMLGGTPLPWFDLSIDATIVKPKTPLETFYNDLDPAGARAAISSLKHHCYQCFFSKSKYAAWRDIPCTYILCEKDNAIPLQVQKHMVESASVKIDCELLDASHSPFLSMPDKVAETLRRSAGERI